MDKSEKIFNFPLLTLPRWKMFFHILIAYILNDKSKVYWWKECLAFQGRNIMSEGLLRR